MSTSSFKSKVYISCIYVIYNRVPSVFFCETIKRTEILLFLFYLPIVILCAMKYIFRDVTLCTCVFKNELCLLLSAY